MPAYCGKDEQGVIRTGDVYRGQIAGLVCKRFGEGWTALAVYSVDANGPIALGGIRNGRMWIAREAA